MTLRHRLYTVPVRTDVPTLEAAAHWHPAHAALFTCTSGLVLATRPAVVVREGARLT